jgi:pSer/pThr/pTyr-binding forkhead associated (FHA) protein
MFNRVILRATNGRQKGRELVLEDETKCVLGRSRDCSHHLDDTSYMVSRRHCLITVAAPSVRIRDLGSLNGTYLNGEEIGRRARGHSFEEALQEEHAEYPLWHGDKLQIGDTDFLVEFDPPPPDAASEPRDQEQLGACGCASI